MTPTEVPFADLLLKVIDNRGRTCPTSPKGIPLIATNCISNERLYPSYETSRRVSEETFRTWFRGHPIPGDLIFVCKGSPGRVCMAPDPVDFCIAQDMVALRANPDRIYPRYLFAALRSRQVQARIGNMHVGTLIPHFKKGDFDKLEIPVPDRSSQIRIGDIYFELSNKIESNSQTCRALERLVRSIFQAWFVDFDPVKARAAGTRFFPGMPQNIFDTLPTRLAESELGLIPEGWRVGNIGDTVSVRGGGTPSTKVAEYWEGGTHFWLTPKHLSGMKEPILLSTDRKITDKGLERISSGLLPVGTVLLSSRAPVGYLVLAGVPTAINQGFIAMVCDGPLPPLYVYHWTLSVMDEIKSRASGTTFPEISKTAFRPIKVCIPPEEILKAFTAIVEPFFEKLTANIKESKSLEKMRNYLLPKLLSGEVRVQDRLLQKPVAN